MAIIADLTGTWGQEVATIEAKQAAARPGFTAPVAPTAKQAPKVPAETETKSKE